MDYVYLKTILLQFLEQRDKKRQADLVKTVLGQLLHFDKYVPSPILSSRFPPIGWSTIMMDIC